MSLPWTPEKAKKESENKVLKRLSLKSPRRWSELLELNILSSRTLKKTLDRLIASGKVYREQKTGDEYPPPVLYGLTVSGKQDVKPITFSYEVNKYLNGEPGKYSKKEISQAKAKGQDDLIRLRMRGLGWNSPYSGSMNKKMKEYGKRMGAIYLYLVLKMLESHAEPKYLESFLTSVQPLFNFMPNFFKEYSIHLTHKDQDRIIYINDEEKMALDLTNIEYSPNKEEVITLIKIFKKEYSKEYTDLEKIWQRVDQGLTKVEL